MATIESSSDCEEVTGRARWLGWSFPAKVTAIFLVIAAVTLALLASVALTQIRSTNEKNIEIRIARAARAASAIAGVWTDGLTVTGEDASRQIVVDDPGRLLPSQSWNALVDEISDVNQGAANLFRFDASTNAFDRIATSFKTPEGERVGGSAVEPGLIGVGHPAFQSLISGEPYIGEVPVAGRLRYAYLTPVHATNGELAGLLAIDVGFSDDLGRVNNDARRAALWITGALLLLLMVAGGAVMFVAFRPLNRLIRVAEAIGQGTRPNGIPHTDRGGEIGHLATALAQVVDLQSDLAARALHDDLTGLPNRAHFLQELSSRIDRLDDDSDGFAVLLIDLDQFKEVNDGLGHSAGDELLIALAVAIRNVLLPDEFLARLGGDEFAVITGPMTSEVDVDQVASRLTDAISGVTHTSVAEVAVTTSMGIVLVPQQADTPAVALSHADLALYRAKRTGRAHWQYYQSTLASPVQRRVHLATELRAAIEARGLHMEYQPMYDVQSGRISGFEALARWDHPVEGPIPPDEFISVAETSGLINALGQLVTELVCAQIRAWADAGLPVPRISVNVSAIQLWQHDFVETTIETLERHGLDRDALCLEITESVIVYHADGRGRDVLRHLAEAGFQLSIDDFGTGYSSLHYLGDLQVHQIKIDRSFVMGTTTDSVKDRLFAGVTTLGLALGLTVVAEGIETEQELDLVRRHGCTLAQGYYLSRPARPEAAAELIAADARFAHPHTLMV